MLINNTTLETELRQCDLFPVAEAKNCGTPTENRVGVPHWNGGQLETEAQSYLSLERNPDGLRETGGAEEVDRLPKV
jgi:hypothetical protein